MFSNLRKGVPLYILHKDETRLEIAEVVGHTEPIPVYGTAYAAGIQQQQRFTVDVDVISNGQQVKLQKLPADAIIADSGGLVVSESRDAITNEIAAVMKISQSVIDSMEHHRQTVQSCKQLLEQLDPETKAKAEREKELSTLKGEVESIKGMLTQLLNNSKKEK